MRLPFERCTVHVPAAGGGPLRLEARHAPGRRGGAVVAPPHPLYGGTLENPVVQHLARGLHGAGLSVLAFNYRGVEASEGRATDSLEAAASDYAASLEALATRATPPLVATGYSFGAGAALLHALGDARIGTVVMVAPPAGMLRSEDLRACAAKLLVVVGEHDELAPVSQLEALLSVRADAKLVVISAADHFFHYGGLGEIESAVRSELEAS